MGLLNVPKRATGLTPFCLKFGHDAVLPVDIFLQSARVQQQNDIQSERYWELMFDELVDLDEERLAMMEVLIRQKECVARYTTERLK